MPRVSGATVITASSSGSLQPTPYRYAVLLERAKQLVQIAAQVEEQMLHALEAGEAEELARLKAQQDVTVATASVQLQASRLAEASQEVQLATLQQQRAQLQADTYDQWIAAGLNQWEKAQVQAYFDESDAQRVVIAADAQIELFKALTTAATGGVTSGLAAVIAAVVGVGAAVRAVGQLQASAARTAGEVAAVRASIERRTQEWQLQKATSLQDVAIGGQEIVIARARVDTVDQERQIAELRPATLVTPSSSCATSSSPRLSMTG